MPNAKIAQWPTPWSLEPNARRNFVDANGRYIGCCSVEDASALVVEAVNNRDELRSALRTIRETIEIQCQFDSAGGLHLDNVPASIIAKILLDASKEAENGK